MEPHECDLMQHNSDEEDSPRKLDSHIKGEEPAQSDKPGKRWLRKEKIGQGAQGAVYRCEEVNTGKQVAAKFIWTHELSRAEMDAIKREVQIMKCLQHKHLVKYLKVTDGKKGKLSIYMEYVAGGSLSSKLRREGALPLAQTRRYTRQLLRVLKFLHEKGIAHRDIKCANILLTKDEKAIKLSDFGAFKEIGSVSLVGGLKGTPHWMAPEVIRQQQTSTDGWFKADVWSLGCTILEMITGHSPWQQYSNPMTAMYQIVCSNNTPTIPETISEDAATFLKSCLQRNPDDRPTMTQLMDHLFVQSKRKRKTVREPGSPDINHGAPWRKSVCQVNDSFPSVEDDDTVELPSGLPPTLLKLDTREPFGQITSEECTKKVATKPSQIPRLRRAVVDAQVEPLMESGTQLTRGHSLEDFSVASSLPRLTRVSNRRSNLATRLRRISTAPTPDSETLVGVDIARLPPISARESRTHFVS